MNEQFYTTAIDKLEEFLRAKRPEFMALYGNVDHDTKSDENDVVTELDKQLEQEIRALLEGLDSSIKIVGEEYGGDPGGTFWTIDPIDGTQAFVRGLPYCSSMISLVVDDQPVLGAVYNFALDDFYSAVAGHGAFCNGKQIHVANRPMSQAYVRTHVEKELISVIMEKAYRVPVTGFVLDLARGSIDGYVASGKKGDIWDYIPRAIIIKEAGGTVTNLGKDTYDWHDKSMVACSPNLHEQLNKLAEQA